MADNSSGYYGSNNRNNNRSPRRWFAIFGGMLVVWTGLYLLAHSRFGVSGYEYASFSTADIRHINSILVNTVTITTPVAPAQKQPVNNSNDGFLDTYDVSDEPANYVTEYPINNFSNFAEEEDRKERTRKVMVYISSRYGEEIDPTQLRRIEQYITTFSPRETGIFLTDYKIRLTSFFWLSGTMVYAEVVAWSIFGVLCGLLFFAGNAIRKGGTQREMIYQMARLFYAPFAAIILVLAYGYIKGDATLHLQANAGILIFAFLLGLYSGTVMEMLDRIRNAVFPSGVPNTAEPEPQTVHLPPQPWLKENSTQPSTATPVSPLPTETTTHTHLKDIPVTNTEAVTQKRRMNDDHEIDEVAIDLKLDFSGLFDEERAQLNRLGFSKAIVTLHNVNGKDIIPAKKASDDMTTFVASEVKPGIYIARATLSQRLRDDQIINLFGEKTAYITEDKPGLELFVKKYEAAD